MRCGTNTSGAELSDDGLYRYHLWRRWDRGDSVVWVMLNPSTADHQADDMTIRKCIGFAKRWGYAGIEVLNLYALRATDPMILRDVEDPEGPGNPSTWWAILRYFHRGPVIAAWGGSFPRALAPSGALCGTNTSGWQCLGRTTEGHPRHPSRLAYGTQLMAYRRGPAPTVEFHQHADLLVEFPRKGGAGGSGHHEHDGMPRHFHYVSGERIDWRDEAGVDHAVKAGQSSVMKKAVAL